MEAVKGLRGYWHYTNGGWLNGDKLRTLCGKGISPNHRESDWDTVVQIIDCPKCRKLLEVARV